MGSTLLQPLIAKLSARSVLSDRDVAALLRMPHTIKRFTPSEYLVRERKPATHTCILLTGFAYRQKVVPNGARQIIGLQVPGDPVDLHNSMLDVSDHAVQGLTDGVAAMVAREDILALAAAHPNIAHAFWIDTLVDGSIAREWIVNIGRRSAHERLAHMFCEFALRLRIAGIEQGEKLALPMTQEQIADVLGLTPVHINRMVRKFEREGLIHRAQRMVTILRTSDLEALAGFDDTYLHIERKEPAYKGAPSIDARQSA